MRKSPYPELPWPDVVTTAQVREGPVGVLAHGLNVRIGARTMVKKEGIEWGSRSKLVTGARRDGARVHHCAFYSAE